jgi:hypothetical protein
MEGMSNWISIGLNGHATVKDTFQKVNSRMLPSWKL